MRRSRASELSKGCGKSKAEVSRPISRRLTDSKPGVYHAREFYRRSPALELKEIKELIALMKRNDLSVFKMEREGFKIVLKKGVDFQTAAAPIHVIAPAAAAA